ncbi:MAG: CdaR family protein, partial [Clostridia bacterium]
MAERAVMAMAMTAKSERGTAKSKNGKKYTFAVVFIASICAILLWLYVLGYESPNYDKNFTQVEVTVIGVNDLIEKTGFTVLTDLSFSFDVTLTGRKTDINSLRTKDITAYVNVANVKKPGEIYLPVEVKVPNGVKVVNQSSSSACIYIDELVTREIPIRIELSDYSIPGDLSIGSQQITPSTVTVTGPKTELLKIEEAYASIKPGIINTSFSTNVSVTLYKKGGEEVKNTYIKLDDSNVTVFTPVLKTKKIPVKVYFVGGVFSVENAIISLSDQYITVRGTAAAVDALSEIAVNVDETTLLVSSSISKKIILPDGVDNISGKESVSANITLLQ